MFEVKKCWGILKGGDDRFSHIQDAAFHLFIFFRPVYTANGQYTQLYNSSAFGQDFFFNGNLSLHGHKAKLLSGEK